MRFSRTVAALGCVAAACTTPSGAGGGGGGSDAGAEVVDASAADGSGGDGKDGSLEVGGDTSIADADAADSTSAGGGDVPADAAAADAGPADASPADTAPADAGAADAAKVDAAGTDLGPKDVAPSDAGPPDAGAADAGPSGGATCASVCQALAKAGCPNDDPVDKCTAGCEKFVASAGPKCAALAQSFLDCVAGAGAAWSLTCTPSGKVDVPVACGPIMKEVEACADGGGPGPCTPGTCYASGGTGGGAPAAPKCGCEETCNGVTVKLDCDGSQCVCTVDGIATPPFPQADACNQPGSVMKSMCGGALPPPPP